MFVLSLIFIVAGLILLLLFRSAFNNKSPLYGSASFVIGVVMLFSSMIYVIEPGHVGVEVFLGKTVKYAESGMHFKNPISSIYNFDIRTVKTDYKAEGTSMDLQLIIVEAAVNYRIDSTLIQKLYNEIGKDYAIKVIDPAVNEAIKSGTAKFKVEDIIVRRHDLKEEITTSLKTKLSNYYIVVENVNLVDIDFSPEFNKVVEEKQIEEQRIKTAEYRKLQAMQEKEATILEAQGEAEKQRLLRNTTSKEVIELKWIEKWNGQLPVTMLGDSKGVIMNMKD